MKKVTFITLLLFASLFSKAQILTETFESGSFPPTGWITMEDAIDLDDAIDTRWNLQEDYETAYQSYGWAHTGNFSAISSFGFMDEYKAYLITPQFTPTPNNYQLHLFYKQAYSEDYNGEFRIYVSTASQNNLSDFTQILAVTEANAPLNFEELVVDLTNYINTPIYVAFVNYDDDGDGDEWYIDDVTMEPVQIPGPTVNPTPADGEGNIQIVNTQTSQIDLSWDAPQTGGSVTQYDLWVGNQPNHLRILGHPTALEAHPKTFHFNTTYYWKASAVNMSGESSDVWSFTTCDFPTVQIPYTIDFENGGFVPDGVDQSVDNDNKFWQYSDDLNVTGHIGNAGDANGTHTQSGGYFAFISDRGEPSPNGTIMYSAKVDIANVVSPNASVYILSNNEGSLNVTFNIDAWNGNDWVNIFTNTGNTNGWEQHTIDLSGFNLPPITQFRFVAIEPSGSNNNDDFAFDDFRVFDANTEIVKLNDDNIQIYPNPVVDFIQINTPAEFSINKVKITDLNGKIIYQNSKVNKINLSNLPKGNYLLTIFDKNNNSYTKKIIKK
jgi:hypothetical protein